MLSSQPVSSASPAVPLLSSSNAGIHKKPRCSFDTCNKIIPVALREFTCRCGKRFCDKHRDIVAHQCSQKKPSDRVVSVGFHEYVSSQNSVC